MSPSRGRNRGKRKNPRLRLRRQAGVDRSQRDQGARVEPLAQPDTVTSSTVVSLAPLAPIIVRSGRPMNSHADADPRRFPPPSTLAGCLRTAWARARSNDFGPELARIAVAGPLLLSQTGEILVPKPADAVYFGAGGSARCIRAEPRAFDNGSDADMPEGLLPVRLTAEAEGKRSDGPTWWTLGDFLAFRSGRPLSYRQLSENGWSMPSGDRRTHLSIDSSTLAAVSGGLFETEGLELGAVYGESGIAANGVRLLARCGEAMEGSVVHLGGKRRLAALRPERESVWPAPPQDRPGAVSKAGGLCLSLVTPAVFTSGYRPGWLNADLTGSPPTAPQLKLKLVAAAVGRWEPHSGWDLARQRPRPTRKLAGAGATYWFRILGEAPPDALESIWLRSICDLDQDRRDGFGLVLPSPWNPPA